MDINIFNTADEVVRAVAERVRDALRRQPELVLGVPAGRTPIGAYAELARLHAAGEVDFSAATAFCVDEFAGTARTHPSSFHHFLTARLFTHVNLQPERIHSLNGVADDLDAECARYEDELSRAGGVDLQLLGIGRNGHIGFNEPGDGLIARTHRVSLREETRRDNAALFGGDASRVPSEALTIGIGTILSSDQVLLIATGASKAECVERMIRGPITTRVPASFLQLHSRVEICLDRTAASRL